MRKVIKYLIPLIPVLVIFGPSFIAIGYNPFSHMWAYIGASMTGLGNGILFLKIMDQSKQIEELSRQLNLFAIVFNSCSNSVEPNSSPAWAQVLRNCNVNAIAVAGRNIYAATENNGIYLSTDDGANWSAVNNGLPIYIGSPYYLPLSSIALCGKYVFAGVPFGREGNVVYRSTNNGTSWSVCDSGISNSSIYALATSGTDIFAGTDSGTFRSTNYGATWTQVGYNPRVINFGVSGSNLFEGTANGAYLTTNNGVSWSSLNSGLPTPKTIVSLAISGMNLLADVDGWYYHSTNNGTSWTHTDSGFNDIYTLAASGSDFFSGHWGGVYRSKNNGASWTSVNTGLTNLDKYVC